MFLLRCVGCSVAVTEQYIGEMETRFIKETEMFRAISRAKTSDRDLSLRNIFDRLQSAVNLVSFVFKSNGSFARY